MSVKTEEIVLYPNSGLQVEYMMSEYELGVLTKAVLMVKNNLSDVDGASLIAKTITTIGNEDGIITGDVIDGVYRPLLVFTILPTETANLVVGTKLVSALKVWTTASNSPSSPAKGRRGVRVEDPGVYQTS